MTYILRLRFPRNKEVCDGIDNDCNEICDDGDLDKDDDKYTICGRKILSDGTCSDQSDAFNDCKPEDGDINPGATEICNGVDDNCNEICDDGFDPDNDKYTECGSWVDKCEGSKKEDIDCKPMITHINPGAEEKCNGFDDNCDGQFYPAMVPCYTKAKPPVGEEACFLGARQCVEPGAGWGECRVENLGDGAIALTPGLCTKYDACFAADEVDPFACTNSGSGLKKSALWRSLFPFTGGLRRGSWVPGLVGTHHALGPRP